MPSSVFFSWMANPFFLHNHNTFHVLWPFPETDRERDIAQASSSLPSQIGCNKKKMKPVATNNNNNIIQETQHSCNLVTHGEGSSASLGIFCQRKSLPLGGKWKPFLSQHRVFLIKTSQLLLKMGRQRDVSNSNSHPSKQQRRCQMRRQGQSQTRSDELNYMII